MSIAFLHYKRKKKKPFPVKSRRQEKASDAVISRRVTILLARLRGLGLVVLLP
jgi:hypothetical protein